MPRFKTVVNTGAEYGTVSVRSAVAAEAGQVMCYEMDGTEDGLSVTDPSATNAFLVAGIAHNAIAAAAKGELTCFGLCTNAIVFQTNTAIAVGDVLDIMSANSCLSRIKAAAVVLNSASNAAVPMFVAVQSLSSRGTSQTVAIKVWVRNL